MTIVTNLGFPRIGARRELKRALESHWRGDTDATQLQHTACELRARHWRLQREAGVDLPPSNDFSLYDHVLIPHSWSTPFHSATAPWQMLIRWPVTSRWRVVAKLTGLTCTLWR